MAGGWRLANREERPRSKMALGHLGVVLSLGEGLKEARLYIWWGGVPVEGLQDELSRFDTVSDAQHKNCADSTNFMGREEWKPMRVLVLY